MSSLQWNDTSHWTQSTTAEERKTPKSWGIRYGALRISLHHYHGLGNTWLVTCYDLNIEKYDLNTEDVEVAKKAAVKRVHSVADKLFRDADTIYNTLGG